MYADDCQIYLSFTDAGSLTMTRFNECLKNVKIWMDKNALKLNAEKTKLKVFSPKNQISNFNLSFENAVIEPSDTVDILGVKLGQNINYTSFISKKVQVISFHLRNLQHVKESLNVHTKTLLIKNLVLSNLDYCNSLLVCATDKDLKPLKMLLNRAVRFICNVPWRGHITPFLQKLHILPIRHRIRFKICLLAFRIINNQAPIYLKEKFETFYPTTSINLRVGFGRDELMFKPLPTSTRKDTIFDKFTKEWNLLPFHIRTSNSVAIFKKKLKTFLFRDAFLIS